MERKTEWCLVQDGTKRSKSKTIYGHDYQFKENIQRQNLRHTGGPLRSNNKYYVDEANIGEKRLADYTRKFEKERILQHTG